MRILRAADHRRMPWKNGGGETIEIAVHPHGAGLDDFDWRVSMARVAADGPFSTFDGVDRILLVLEGAGLELTVDGMGTHSLVPASEPFAFPADAATVALLHAGPIGDLNVMTRRGRAGATLNRCRSDEPGLVLSGPGLVIALGVTHLAGHELGLHDALLLAEGEEAIAPDTGRGADLLHVALTPRNEIPRGKAGRDPDAISGE